MEIHYNSKTDLLYLRLYDRKQKVLNKKLSGEIVIDIGNSNRIVGIEIVDASRNLNLERLLPLKWQVSP